MKKIIFALALLGAVSCGRKVETAEPPIRLVSDILAGENAPMHSLVSEYNYSDSDKSIFVIGDPFACEAIRQGFLSCDYYDNVDGRTAPDGLPDFSGEVVCTMVDFANLPYSDFVKEGRTHSLREVTVRDVLTAMDTLCFVNEFDRNGVASKPLPKMIVMSSPYYSEYGRYDLDSLMGALNCRIPIIYPVKTMLDNVVWNSQTGVLVGVVASRENIASSAYSSFLSARAAQKGLEGSACIVFPSDTSALDPMLAFLDSCMASGNSRPLDAIIVDDTALDADLMRATLARVTSGTGSDALAYGKLISPDCSLQDVTSAAAAECYRLLRKGNLFTHNIAYPRSLEFQTVRIADSTYVLTQYDKGDLLQK